MIEIVVALCNHLTKIHGRWVELQAEELYYEGKLLSRHKHEDCICLSLKSRLIGREIVERKKIRPAFQNINRYPEGQISKHHHPELDIFFLKMTSYKRITNKYNCHSPGAFLCFL